MVKIYLFLFSITFSFALNAQISKDDQAEITRLAGKNLLQLRVLPSYPYTSLNDKCTVQPSLTVRNDTTGVYFNNEYLLFRSPIHFKQGKEVLKLMRPEYVTVAEYLAFQNDIRDSIAREKIYQCLEGDKESNSWIMFDEKYVDPKTKKLADPSNRERSRELFALNRKKAVPYASNKYMPCVVDMYLPQPERINKLRLFDERKLIYRYTDIYEQFASMSKAEITALFPNFGMYRKGTEVEHNISTLTDPYRWSIPSRFDRDEYSVLGQLYNQLLSNEPVIGISGMQANAFCHWKQAQMQREIDGKGLKYTVIVTLPAFEDLPSRMQPKLVIPEKDYTEQWKITVQEYERFVAYTKDSVLREALYLRFPNLEAMKLLDYNPKQAYFDEGALEFHLVDTFDMQSNRYYFPLNYKVKLQKFGTVTDSIMQSGIYTNPHFHYEHFDALQRTIIGKLSVDRRKYDYERSWDTTNLDLTEIGADGEWIGKDLAMDVFFSNSLNQSYGVRSYENLRRLIHFDSVAVLPAANAENTNPKALMKGISYAQAIAFYYWKYPLHKQKSNATWQDFVLPSEAQFEKIQRGEQILVPKREMEYPAPLFRYVVHVYPKVAQ